MSITIKATLNQKIVLKIKNCSAIKQLFLGMRNNLFFVKNNKKIAT